MSSKSPKISKRVDTVVIGDNFTAPLFARALRAGGAECLAFSLEPVDEKPRMRAIHLGNGEVAATAKRIFGREIFDEMWAFSRENFQRAGDSLPQWGVRVEPGEVHWYAANNNERSLLEQSSLLVRGSALSPGGSFADKTFVSKLREPALFFDVSAFRKATPDVATARLTALETLAGLENHLVLEVDGKKLELRAPVVVLATDLLDRKLVPGLEGKWLPVSLSTFRFPASPTAPPRARTSLFNGGADYAASEGRELVLGSYRNLFEDKAFGIQETPDSATLSGVTRFFGELEWLADTNPTESRIQVESLSCDGLPIVGALSDMPGTYFVGSFAGRGQNFLFEVAFHLASGIVGKKGFGPLDRFTTKRFL